MRQALRALFEARGLLSNSSGNTFAVLKALPAAKAPVWLEELQSDARVVDVLRDVNDRRRESDGHKR
jgi:hypothetical protein